MSRWAWAEVDLGAIEHNVRVLRDVAAPSELWAVVKADGYGHGAVPVADAALRAGAVGLCVALVQEGVSLRDGGIEAPVLVLSEQPPEELPLAVAYGLICTVYSVDQVTTLARAVAAAGGTAHPVHLKVDTGMRRVGAAPSEAVAVADAVLAAAPLLQLTGVFTHLPVADEPEDPFTASQLQRLDAVLGQLAAAGHRPPVVHSANSAGLLAHAGARRTLVRAGIAIYGISPGPGVDQLAAGVRPALSLRARVAHVKRVHAGERISYGLRHTFAVDTTVATLPIGYADGVPRRLSSVGGEVLVGGCRCPIVGVVTMDQLMLDVGDRDVAVGDVATLIGGGGRPGDDAITAAEWAQRLGTIGYEIVCGISKRVERRYN